MLPPRTTPNKTLPVKWNFFLTGYNRDGFDREGFDVAGYNRLGYSQDGYDINGFNSLGRDRGGNVDTSGQFESTERHPQCLQRSGKRLFFNQNYAVNNGCKTSFLENYNILVIMSNIRSKKHNTTCILTPLYLSEYCKLLAVTVAIIRCVSTPKIIF